MVQHDESNAEEETIDELDQDEPSTFRYHITAYGADYPVDSLVNRIDSGDVVVPTFDPNKELGDIKGFQRRFIWKKAQSDRFIESLLLGLPVPGIFLVSRTDGRLLVLDGQQRLRTLHSFYRGELRGKGYSLEKVQDRFVGRTYSSLDVEDRRKLDNSIIHATVVRQDEPSKDQSSIYMIFERLNTGGTALHPQEIRIALYGGPFMNFLQEMNSFGMWREIYGKISPRFKDQELILRFFALLYAADKYERPMRDFLNVYAGVNQEFQLQSEDELREIFKSTTASILGSLGKRAFRTRNAINVAIMDSVMVGVANRIQARGKIQDLEEFAVEYKKLIDDAAFSAAVERSTTDERSVRNRLTMAKQAFSKLG